MKTFSQWLENQEETVSLNHITSEFNADAIRKANGFKSKSWKTAFEDVAKLVGVGDDKSLEDYIKKSWNNVPDADWAEQRNIFFFNDAGSNAFIPDYTAKETMISEAFRSILHTMKEYYKSEQSILQRINNAQNELDNSKRVMITIQFPKGIKDAKGHPVIETGREEIPNPDGGTYHGLKYEYQFKPEEINKYINTMQVKNL